MDANTPLWKAHDISQKLQDKLEVLPNVGRAFVHVDHETTHTPVRATFPLSTVDRMGAECLGVVVAGTSEIRVGETTVE
jgi:hypothetical protein